MMEKINEIRNKKNASLVVAYQNGTIKEYYQNRILDLVSILKENETALKGSTIADKENCHSCLRTSRDYLFLRKSSRLYKKQRQNRNVSYGK